jgi:glycosyltransferase involved in cell wall biosynthesis
MDSESPGNNEADITYVKAGRSGRPSLKYYHDLITFYRKLRESFKPDILHIHSPSGLPLAVYEKDIPVVTSVHAIEPFFNRRTVFGKAAGVVQRRIRRYRIETALAVSAKAIAVSEKTRSDIGVFLPEHLMSNLSVIGPGIDCTLFKPGSSAMARKALGLGEGLIVLYVGRLLRKKKVSDIIEAIAGLKHRLPGIRALIVGDGPYEMELKKQASQYDVANLIQFEGGIPNRELPQYYWAADVFVNPTAENETFGLSTGEAMACGVPVVISDQGAQTGVIPGDLGIVYKGIDGLSEAIMNIHTNRKEAERRADEASTYAMQHSFANTLGNIEKLYEDICTNRHSERRGNVVRAYGSAALMRIDSIIHDLGTALISQKKQK